MSDPVVWGSAVVALVVGIGPSIASAVKGLLSRRDGVVAVDGLVRSAEIPSRYRWTEQEIASLQWATAHVPEGTTVAEFLAKMYADDMVSETCVLILSPAKAVTE